MELALAELISHRPVRQCFSCKLSSLRQLSRNSYSLARASPLRISVQKLTDQSLSRAAPVCTCKPHHRSFVSSNQHRDMTKCKYCSSHPLCDGSVSEARARLGRGACLTLLRAVMQD